MSDSAAAMGVLNPSSRGKGAMIAVTGFAVANLAAVLCLLLMATVRLAGLYVTIPPESKLVVNIIHFNL